VPDNGVTIMDTGSDLRDVKILSDLGTGSFVYSSEFCLHEYLLGLNYILPS
jgi:hypothetical protein